MHRKEKFYCDTNGKAKGLVISKHEMNFNIAFNIHIGSFGSAFNFSAFHFFTKTPYANIIAPKANNPRPIG